MGKPGGHDTTLHRIPAGPKSDSGKNYVSALLASEPVKGETDEQATRDQLIPAPDMQK